jgi:4-hydroxy-tetrahydrodipicolinate synthase
MFVTASPAPVKAALSMLGHDAGTLRCRSWSAIDAEREHVRSALAAYGLLQEVHTT